MEKLKIALEQLLPYMDRYRLTPEEVLVIDLLFLASSEERHPEFLSTYMTLPVSSPIVDILKDLQKKGIILASCKLPKDAESFDPETITFNKNFLHNHRKYSGELGYEFRSVYPKIGYINGTEVHLNNVAKRFNDIEDFDFHYGKIIGWNVELHNKILALVKWGVESKSSLMKINICDFVISKMWENLEQLKNGDGIMYFDNTTDI